MSKLKQQMIATARQRFGVILPCGCRGSIDECFTTEGTKVIFWFNASDGSTHVNAREMQD